MTMLRCGTVQFHHKADDKARNMAVVERFCREAAEQRVKILAFPEMCLTGYWHVRDLPRESHRGLVRTRTLGAFDASDRNARKAIRHGHRRRPDREDR